MSETKAVLYKYQTQGGREVTLLDESGAYTEAQVRQHFAATYPELTNASSTTDDTAQTVQYEGNEVEVAKVVTFKKTVGTKGADLVFDAFEVTGEVKLANGRFFTIEREWVTALNQEQAETIALNGVINAQRCDGDWTRRPLVRVVEEAERLRAIGSPVLPGFEEVG